MWSALGMRYTPPAEQRETHWVSLFPVPWADWAQGAAARLWPVRASPKAHLRQFLPSGSDAPVPACARVSPRVPACRCVSPRVPAVFPQLHGPDPRGSCLQEAQSRSCWTLGDCSWALASVLSVVPCGSEGRWGNWSWVLGDSVGVTGHEQMGWPILRVSLKIRVGLRPGPGAQVLSSETGFSVHRLFSRRHSSVTQGQPRAAGRGPEGAWGCSQSRPDWLSQGTQLCCGLGRAAPLPGKTPCPAPLPQPAAIPPPTETQRGQHAHQDSPLGPGLCCALSSSRNSRASVWSHLAGERGWGWGSGACAVSEGGR